MFDVFLVLVLLMAAAPSTLAATRYVWQGSPSPGPPYDTWSNAAHDIQTAADAAGAGDDVVVTNGVYAMGSRAVGTNVLANRVAVDKPLTVRSVNGPEFTVIEGYQVPGTTNGDGAIRCVYLTSGASLSGFALTNGATRVWFSGISDCDLSGGGVWCESNSAVVSNCVLTGNSASQSGGGAWGGTLFNCIVIGNLATEGGGAYGATLSNCTLTGNSARWGGGGAYGSTLDDCTLTGNSACYGGGAEFSTLSHCTLATNRACHDGGGARDCTLNNCMLRGNSAERGGGAYGDDVAPCVLNNCSLTGNSALPNAYRDGGYGGGVAGAWCTLSNCTLTGNSAVEGGGASGGTLYNCIVYFNTATHGANHSFTALNYCCTTPLVPGGTGNIALDPQLASASHLSAFSPCRGAGSTAFASGTDIDGELWADPPSIGCDEYRSGAVAGPLSVTIAAACTNVATGFLVDFTAIIDGRTTASVWEFGDGTVVSDRPFTAHAWTAPGDYTVVLRAYNESQPEGLSAMLGVHVVEAIHHVAASSTNPVSPYSSWATAATNIQDAVDAATVTGALVLVTNGVYAVGERDGNRVRLTNSIRLESVNGPAVTIMRGDQFANEVGEVTNGLRCVFLGSNAVLSGFTLTNGYATDGGGLFCESVSALVSNCVLTGNSAWEGAGVYGGTLNNCTLTGNSAYLGGGAASSELNNCTLTGNSAYQGGGACWCTLSRCTLTGNSAEWSGGGAAYGTLDNCRLSGNSAELGGGAAWGTLYNSVLTGNSAVEGGGAGAARLYNCTITGNRATNAGGGACGLLGWDPVPVSLVNCVVYFNTAPRGANYGGNSWECFLDYCCTAPLPEPMHGVGNISSDPQLASLSHLSASSPCRGAGSALYACGTDIDGEAWAAAPAIGCDELHSGAVTGPLNVTIAATHTNVATGFLVDFTAIIDGRTTASVWEFGDGTVVSDRPFTAHAWTAPGDYTVVLRAHNESYPGGVRATQVVHVVPAPVHYVAANSANPLPPYNSWSTAATNIQDAVDAAGYHGGIILVSNGVYAAGGRAVVDGVTNRVAVDRGLLVQSVNGPQFTTIQGGWEIRCVYLASGASLSGFTWTEGFAEGNGGGARCESVSAVVSNCVLTGNGAVDEGGGASGGTLYNCALIGNWASNAGGGAAWSALNNCTVSNNWGPSSGGGVAWGALNNCTLISNSAIRGGGAAWGTLNNCTLVGNCVEGTWDSYGGGGAYGGTLNNCIVYFNTAMNGANYWGNGLLNYCCTTPLPTNGVGNIASPPLFLDGVSGNWRLQTNSPCVNAGNNSYLTDSSFTNLFDLDGFPRIVSGTVDIGAYEYQGAGSVISYAWLQQYGLPTDSSVDCLDPDIDGHNNWQEWRCQTCPTNALSILRLLSASANGTNITVTWQSVTGVNYFLERSTNLATPFIPVGIGIVGQPQITSWSDANATGVAPVYYRVGVEK